MKKIAFILLLALTLTSCTDEMKDGVKETGDIIEEYGDTLEGGIKDAKDVKEKIEENNKELDNILNDNNQSSMNKKYQMEGPQDGDLVAVMKTTNGTMKIRLFRDDVPSVVNNFIGLASDGYYKDIIFHRVINGFMIQGGDPDGTGMGGKSIYGAKFDDEFSDKLSNIKYSISMANSGPDTNGSQFFINQADNTNLDFNKQPLTSKHAVFGQVYEGMENVDKIAKTKTETGDRPVKDIKIISLEIKEFQNGSLKDYKVNTKDLVEKYNKTKEEKKEADKNRVVKAGDKIAVTYTGTLEDGSVFDSSEGRPPLEFSVAAGQMIPGFDAGVVGMKIGDKKTLVLKPKDAYGEIDEKRVQEVPKDQLKSFEDNGIKLVVGAELPTPQGVFKIKEIKDDIVIIDVNHPLAGKTLTFEVELVEFKN